MTFRMRCVKCGSTNLDLEEDQRAFLGGGRHQVLLHCYTCGMILYGEDKIQSEYDQQYRGWEAEQKELKARQARARKAAPVAPAPQPAPAVAAPVSAPVSAPAAAAPASASETPAAAESSPAPAPKAAPPAAAVVADAAPAAAEASPGAPAPAPAPRAAKKPAGKLTEPANSSAADGARPCAWVECDKTARPNSKYCSRNCSNKNARARHAQRKRKPRKKAEAAP